MDTSRRKTGRFPHFFKPFVIRSTPWPKRIRSLGFTGPRRRLGVRGCWWWSNGVWWMGGIFPVGRWRCEVQIWFVNLVCKWWSCAIGSMVIVNLLKPAYKFVYIGVITYNPMIRSPLIPALPSNFPAVGSFLKFQLTHFLEVQLKKVAFLEGTCPTMHEGATTDTSDLFGMGCLWFSRALVRCCISPYGRPWEAKSHLARGAVEQAVGPMFELGCDLASPRSAFFASWQMQCVHSRASGRSWWTHWSIAHVEGAQLHEARSVFTRGRAALKQCADGERSWNGSARSVQLRDGLF